MPARVKCKTLRMNASGCPSSREYKYLIFRLIALYDNRCGGENHALLSIVDNPDLGLGFVRVRRYTSGNTKVQRGSGR
jgi:hypothetical protein